MTSQSPVRVRFAPSPTGALHIGGAHTALFNWLWARRNQGKFVLRVEDTDRERSTSEFEQTILQGMQWMGLDWDEGPDIGGPNGPYRQSERTGLYMNYAEELISRDLAYREGPAVIFSVPKGKRITFNDHVYGVIEMESDTLKDIVIIKSDGSPTYNFAVVVDDYTMDITWVIRGEDHISNTPKQALLYEALGWRLPNFAHLPMILGDDKKKLSKRHGATSVYEYRDKGYLPEGLFNYFALLGWYPGEEREIFTREEAIALFDLDKITKRAAVFDMTKLNHVNQAHLWMMDRLKRVELVKPFWTELGLQPERFSDEWLASVLEMLEGRGQTTREAAEYSDYFLSFDSVCQRYDGSDIPEENRAFLREFFSGLLAIGDWTAEAMETTTRAWCEENAVKLKHVAMPLRWILTGRKVSPGIFHVAVFLGREETAKRLAHYDLA